MNKKILLFLIFLCFISIVSVSAVDDSPANDTSKSFTDLENLIKDAESGSTINLDSDYAYDEGFSINGVTINKNITINGNGHTLDGKNTARILNIDGGNVVLNNTVFRNGYASNSIGAIKCSGAQLTITKCTFIENHANGTSAGNSRFAQGIVAGAVYIYSDNCIISDNRFINNTVGGSGGAVAIDGKNNLIEGNTFTNNKALHNMNGGALQIGQGANNIIRGNTFENNFAGMGGGAVELQKSSGDIIENNRFINNKADYGGALSIYNTGYFTLKNNYFEGNSANGITMANNLGIGGALRVYITDSSKTSVISGNAIKSNVADTTGGAFYILGDNIKITGNKFTSNKASSKAAGAVRTVGNNIDISDNEFTTNSAGRSGGALYLEGNNIKVTGNNFKNNRAPSGCDVAFANSDKGRVTGNTFDVYKKTSIATDHCHNMIIRNNKRILEKTKIKASGKTYFATSKIKPFSVTLKNSKGKTVSGKKLTLKVNGKTYKAKTNKKGKAVFRLILKKAKSYKAVVSFSKTTYLKSSSKKLTLKVKKEKTRIGILSKKNKKLTVYLKSQRGLHPTDIKLTLKIKGKSYSTKTDKKGRATFAADELKGRYKCKVTFSGDSKYKSSTLLVK